MTKYHLPEISENVFAVGAKDWNRQVFDALVPLPRGTSFNSYLVKGEEKTALIDTVGPGFENELAAKVSQLTDISRLDYIIMNHAEPDHGAAISSIMKLNNATLITSEKGAVMATRFHNAPADRIKTVKEGETIELGGKTLRFIEAPWLHWPETMFTYLVENGVLFSGDFFGAHVAVGTFETDVEDIFHFAKSYFGEIMMPLKAFGKKAMDKLAGLEIRMIAPTHGPAYKNPKTILDQYRRWTAGETEKKVIMPYVTMWNSTEALVKTMFETMSAQGIEVKLHNLIRLDVDLLAADLVDSRGIVLGTPTVLSAMHPLMAYAIGVMKALKPPLKYGAVLNSYGWGRGAVKQALEFFEFAKIESLGAVEVNGPPLIEDHQKVMDLGMQLAARIMAPTQN
jgi:flavorubredoxin